MKRTKYLILTLTALSFVGTLVSSCSTTDVDDVYKKPDTEKSINPIADLKPSANFTWSTMDKASITIEVDDQYNSEKDYLVDVYTVNPASEDNATPIYTCVVRGNAPANTDVNFASYINKLYLKVQDPDGVETVYTYDAPAANASITCPCDANGTVISSTRSEYIATRADEETINGNYSAGYTINFEDQWPSYGDYDLNDVVLRVKDISTVQGKKNEVESATMTFELLAVGAGYELGIGLQFDEINNSNIKDVTHSLRDMPGLSTTDAGAFDIHSNDDFRESGGGNLPIIVPLAYDAHKLLLGTNSLSNRTPINTRGTDVPAREFTVTLEFNSKDITPEHFNLSALNFFIYRLTDDAASTTQRVEIHMKGYSPTRSASSAYFGTADDNSNAGTYYTSSDNFPWAVVVNDLSAATPWTWPSENELITTAYPRFENWVNGEGAEDWMFK